VKVIFLSDLRILSYIRQVDISFLIIFADSDFEMMIPYCVQL